MRINFKKSTKKIPVISIITITILMITSLIYLFSCTAGVDIGGANRVLKSFSISWPSGFHYNCKYDEPTMVKINALDQNGEVFDSWSGIVIISCTNVSISVYPSTVPVINGSEEVEIVFESVTEEVQQVQIKLSYGGIGVEIEDVLLVGLLAPKGVMATDGLDEDLILIKWDAMEYAQRYEVFRSESESGTYSYLADTTSLSYQDADCAAGTTYHYKVRAYLGTYYDYSDLSDSDSGYKRNYVFILKWGSSGTGDGQFSYPRGVAVDSAGNVYVADSANARIQKFDSNGGFLTKWGSEGTGDGQFAYPNGVAVDSAGNVYVADTGNNRIQKWSSDGTFIGWWGRDNLGVTGWHAPGSGRTGDSGTGDGEFDTPRGVAVDSDGNVYVADTYNSRIQKFDASGVFITKWGSEGTGDGQFEYLCGIAVDSDGNVYVADTGNNRIQKFDASGGILTKWGEQGTGDGEFDIPRGVAVDSAGNVYVADYMNHRFQKWSSDGTFIGWWGRDDLGVTGWHAPGSGRTGDSGRGDGQFEYLCGIAVDSDGNVYVADTTNYRIQKFDASGFFIIKWGGLGADDGQFNNPLGVAVDSAGNVYVVDSANARIQKFDSNGGFLTKWGSQGTSDGQFDIACDVAVDFDGRVYVVDADNNRIQRFDASGGFITKWGILGTGDGEFNTPYGVAVDSAGNVYVADTYNHRIQKFDASGDFLTEWGGQGTGVGQFDTPTRVAVDSAGNVYVADTYNDRIQRFDASGVFITKWGGLGTGDGEFNSPWGVAVDFDGRVYVADTTNHRIQKFW